jgi:hypothetical protein
MYSALLERLILARDMWSPGPCQRLLFWVFCSFQSSLAAPTPAPAPAPAAYLPTGDIRERVGMVNLALSWVVRTKLLRIYIRTRKC